MATTVNGALALGQAVRAARVSQHLTQAELARDARVGRQWLVEFEVGDKPSAPLDMVLRLLRELGLAVTLDPARPAQPAPPRPIIRADDVLARYTDGG
jgi:transcriptional regulator with XRE-family HTH domain